MDPEIDHTILCDVVGGDGCDCVDVPAATPAQEPEPVRFTITTSDGNVIDMGQGPVTIIP